MLLSKYEMGLDRRTPYERRRGRWCNMMVLPFGNGSCASKSVSPRRGKTSLRARIWRVSGLGTTGARIKF